MTNVRVSPQRCEAAKFRRPLLAYEGKRDEVGMQGIVDEDAKGEVTRRRFAHDA